MTLSKKDYLLAQKSIAAKEIKERTRISEQTIKERKASYSLSPTKRQPPSPLSKSFHNLTFSSSTSSLETTTTPSKINRSSSMESLNQFLLNDLNNTIKNNSTNNNNNTHNNNSSKDHCAKIESVPVSRQLSSRSSSLIQELSKKSLTEKALLRKTHHMLESTAESHENSISSPTKSKQNDSPKYSINSSSIFPISHSNNFKHRSPTLNSSPLGPTLSQIYDSRKNDTWGLLVSSQAQLDLINEEKKKLEEKKKKEEYKELLLKQCAENLERKDINNTIKINDYNNNLKNYNNYLEEEKNTKLNKINEEKKFYQNILNDIKLKNEIKTNEMIFEINNNILENNLLNELKLKDKLEQEEKLNNMKKFQNILYEENIETINKKKLNKILENQKDKKIYEEYLKNEKDKDDKKKQNSKDFFNLMYNNNTYKLYEDIYNKKEKESIKFQQENLKQKNLFDKQHELSEKIRKEDELKLQKLTLNDQYLSNSNIFNNSKIISSDTLKEIDEKYDKDLKEFLKKQDEIENEKNRFKNENMLKFYKDLENQLNEDRNRKLNSLKNTMSNDEKLININLILDSQKILNR